MQKPLSIAGEGGVSCLVVVPSEGDFPKELVEGIRRREIDVRVTQEVDDALKMLDETGAGVMVIAEPQEITGIEVMVTSAKLRFPGLRVWRYAHGTPDALRPYEAGDARAAAARSKREPAHRWRDDVPVSMDEMSALLGELGVQQEGEPPPIGDVELVERMLGIGGRDVSDTAVRLIRQRTGLQNVTFKPDDVTDDSLGVPVTFGTQTFGYLHGGPDSDLTESAMWLARWLELVRRQQELTEMAHRDELTGLWNRRYFHKAIALILEEAIQNHLRVTLMIYDVDNFKQYNDAHGHHAGDEILIETARLMSSVVRKQDVVARVGGDEFAVIFWDAEPQREPDSDHPRTVREAAERFQNAVREHKFPKLGKDAPGRLTISGGLAGFPLDGDTPAQLIEHADRMLRQSKAQGKNVLTFGEGVKNRSKTDHG